MSNVCAFNKDSRGLRNIFRQISKNTDIITAEGVGNTLGRFIKSNFEIESNTEQELKSSLLEYIQTVLLFETVLSIRDNLLFINDHIDTIISSAMNYGNLPSEDTNNPNMEIRDGEFFLIEKLVEYSTLNDLYGTAQLAKTEMQSYFRANVISSIFINFDTGKTIKSDEEVNLAITLFLLQLALNILDYAKLVNPDIVGDIKLYNENGIYQPQSFMKLISIAKLIFSGFNLTKLNNIYVGRSLPKNNIALLAYNSWVILNNFDMLIKNLLGKTISIDSLYEQAKSFQNAGDLKYKLRNESNLVKTWRSSEEVNALDELGSITKLMIDSAPMYEYDRTIVDTVNQRDRRLPALQLLTKDVLYAFSKVSEHPELKNSFLNIRYNPTVYVPKLIESALRQNFGQDDLNIKNILYSVYKRFFLPIKKDSDTQWSLRQIINLELKESAYITENNLLAYITGMIDKTIPNNYLEYAMDADSGRVAPRFSSASNVDNNKYLIQRNIENMNEIVSDLFKEQLLLDFELTEVKLFGSKNNNPTQWSIKFNYNGINYYVKFDNTIGGLKLLSFTPTLNNQVVTDKDSIQDAIIHLLDSTLHLSLFAKPELITQLAETMPNIKTLVTGEKDKLEALTRLIPLAGRVLLKHKFDKELLTNRSKIMQAYGILSYNENTYELDKYIDKRTNKIKAVISENKTNELLRLVATAQMIVNGEMSKQTVRNLEGNSIAALGLTNYIHNVQTVFEDARLTEDSAVKPSIFVTHPKLLKRITVKSAAQTSDKLITKLDRLFNVAESGYSAIMFDFLAGYGKQQDSTGKWTIDSAYDLVFLPTVYSDKTTNSLLNIDKTVELIRGKKLVDMTSEEVKQVHFESMSEMYDQMKKNITNDYNLFFRIISHEPGLEASLRAANIDPNGEYTYEDFRNKIFPIINTFANGNNKIGTKFENKTAVQVFNEIISFQSENIVNIHNVGKTNIETNPVLDYHFAIFNGSDRTYFNMLVKRNQARFVKDCLNNFKIYWKDEKGNIDPILKGAVYRLGYSNAGDFSRNWVDQDTDLLIIAKVNGIPITVHNLELLNPKEITSADYPFELNPILDIFYNMDLMFSTQFITATVGGCYGHKNNFKSSQLEPGTLEYYEEQEAGRLLTQYKRMVIYPATMHNYLLELLTGCPTQLTVANIEDIKAPVFNFLDILDDIDAHDGAGYCTPWESEWENGSLGDAACGDDKKTIGHSMNLRYLMGTEDKWALFAFTNERIRMAGTKNGGVIVKDLMRRMTNREWDTAGIEFDITKNAFGENVSFISLGKRVIFRATDLYLDAIQAGTIIPGHHYQVNDIKFLGNSQYEVILQEVDLNGVAISLEFKAQKEINSNYKLWETFGAEYSEEIETDKFGNTTLIPSKQSVKIVAFYGNNTGIIRSKENPIKMDLTFTGTHALKTLLKQTALRSEQEIRSREDLSLMDIYQPLKHSDISYLINISATKNGLTNVNPRNAWKDESELYTYKISTRHFGVLMDADHHADDAELTEMSLVISALESNGYTHHLAKEAYQDLGAIVYTQIRPYINAIEKYYSKGDNSQLYEVVGKAFLDSFKNSSANRSDLADLLVANLKKQLGNKASLLEARVWIPFSDNTVLSKLIAGITSQINKSAIKRKYSGIGAVLIPAYDIIKIYRYKDDKGKYVDSTFTGLVNLSGTPDSAADYLEQLTKDSDILSSKQLRLGRTYRNIETGEVVTLDTYDKYKEYRKLLSLRWQEDFTQGRNLLPARTTFKIEDDDNSVYDIYDTDAIVNRIRFSKWLKAYKNSNNQLKFLTRKELLSSIYDPETGKTFLLELEEILFNIHYNRDKIFGLSKKGLLSKLNDANKNSYIDFYVKQIGEVLKQEVVDTFDHLHNKNYNTVWIDGLEFNIDPDSIEQEEAELVLSKIYATKFGLSVGTNLNDVNEDFFIRLLEKIWKPNNNLYDIALKKASGRHTYIINPDKLLKVLSTNSLTLMSPRTDVDYSTGILYRLDDEGKKIMPFEDCLLYVGLDGTEYIVTNNIKQFLDDKEYESIQINPNGYAEQSFNLLKNSGDNRLLDKIKKELTVLGVIAASEVEEMKALRRAAINKYTSFLKSLQFTAARIPSQSMQSFMPMKVVGFTDSEENKAYVSHFLTFLQGSDYDIDKVYLLGNEFDENGKYIGWSPLFDLTSIETLTESEDLPMPSGKEIFIEIKTNNTSDSELNNYIDVTGSINYIFDLEHKIKDLRKQVDLARLSVKNANKKNKAQLEYDKIKKQYIDYKVEYIKTLAELLNKINEGENSTFVYDETINIYDRIYPTRLDIVRIEKLINRHQTYFEHVSDSKLLAMTKNSVSSKIRRIINDPLNMVAAYSPIEMDAPKEAASQSKMGEEEREYNQMVPSVKWKMHEQNMVGKTAIGITAVGEKVLFALQYYYNEIALLDKSTDIGKKKQIRALFSKHLPLSPNEKIHTIRHIIANVRLRDNGNNTIWKDVIEQEYAELERLGESGEDFDLRSELLLMQLSTMVDSALINSALLSAATDNAKELILSKINANPDMLKIYTYSIILGVDFNDIARFMTSPTVTIINDLSKSNIFDKRYLKRSINIAVLELTGGLDIFTYGIRLTKGSDLASLVFDEIVNIFTGYTNKDNINIPSFWQQYVTENRNNIFTIAIPELQKLKRRLKESFKNISEKPIHYRLMMRYMDDLETLLRQTAKTNVEDIATFNELLDNGEELNILGRILGINQGIKTNMSDKINYLDNLENLFSKRVKDSKLLYENLDNSIKQYITEEEFNRRIERATDLEIIVPNGSNMVGNLNALRFLLDDNYKEAVIDLYDLIKNTINVFDVIDTVPHFKAMIKAAAVDFTLFNANSAKFELLYNLAKKIKAKYTSLTARQKVLLNNNISGFLSDIITTNYFRDNGIIIAANFGFYDPQGDFLPGNGEHKYNLATAEGQASFKYWFETVVIPRLKLGKTSDTSEQKMQGLISNKFITDLCLSTSNRTLTGNLRYIWTLPINMSNIQSENDINNYVSYLSAFTNLELYTYNGIPLVRLFSYYNLITYKNQYGLDSLTRIFENYMLLPKNEMLDYFDYVGQLDYNKLISEDDFSEDDLLLACAVDVSYRQTQEVKNWGLYIKVYNPETGTKDIYEFDKKKYFEAKKEQKGWKSSNDSYSNDDDDLLFDAMGGDIEGGYVKPEPLCYSPVTSINSRKKDLMNAFPFINPSLVLKRESKKDPVTILKELFKLRKILILKDCA